MNRRALFLFGMLALVLSPASRTADAAEKAYRLGVLSPGAGVIERMRRTTFPELPGSASPKTKIS